MALCWKKMICKYCFKFENYNFSFFFRSSSGFNPFGNVPNSWKPSGKFSWKIGLFVAGIASLALIIGVAITKSDKSDLTKIMASMHYLVRHLTIIYTI